jgi:hypothetical protein
VIGGRNSAGQAVWLARGGALVTLLHRRADLRETMFLGARPCTEWLDDVTRDASGFILTGGAAGAEHLLESTIPGAVQPVTSASALWA